jgi:hypothetical protein
MAYLFTSASSQAIHNASSAPVTAFPLTIAAWVKCTSFGGQAVCISNGAGLVQVSINASGQATAFARDDSQAQQFTATTATTAATTGTWNHIAAVFASASSRTAYLNGVASATNTSAITNSIAAYNRISIGSRFVGARDSFFNGDIAEVGVWNAALAANEIAGLAKGFRCRMIRPQSLCFDLRMIRDLQDLSRALAMTNTNGATVSTHPRIIYP